MSYKQELFEGVPKKNVNKTRLDLSHQWKGEILLSTLCPVLCEETMPGDEFDLMTEYMFRFDTLYYPIMVLMTMRADTYFFPFRILWPEGVDTNVGWKRWIAEQEEIIPPYMNAEMLYDPALINRQVLNFMGIPMIEGGVTKTTTISNLNAFYLAGYLAIWDEYERNPLLEEPIGFPLVAGNNTTAFNTAFNVVDGKWPVLPSKWMKDYLTSAIPTPQLGDAIKIPMWGTHWVEEDETTNAASGALAYDSTIPYDIGDGQSGVGATTDSIDSVIGVQNEKTIKDLRLAEVLQAFYERIAKIGTRYRDWIKGMFGKDPEPGVVDVPILIRSTFGRVQISDVMTQAATVGTLSDEPLSMTGDYRGQANLYEAGNTKIRYNCTEHGCLMQILQVNPDTSYGQGIARKWRRTVQTDYPMDIFAGIGDQEILKEEVMYNSITAELAKNNDTFGYIPRFSEMRYRNNIHAGTLNYGTGLSMHLGRVFDIDDMTYDNLVIDQDFVTAYHDNAAAGYGGLRVTDAFRTLPIAPDTSDLPARPTIKAHIFHSLYVNRQLPLYSTPGKGI